MSDEVGGRDERTTHSVVLPLWAFTTILGIAVLLLATGGTAISLERNQVTAAQHKAADYKEQAERQKNDANAEKARADYCQSVATKAFGWLEQEIEIGQDTNKLAQALLNGGVYAALPYASVIREDTQKQQDMSDEIASVDMAKCSG